MHAHRDNQSTPHGDAAPQQGAGSGMAGGGSNEPARPAAADPTGHIWTVAAQLASGLLSNPSKASYSVKDSISLFDEVLHELQSYTRVRSGLSGSGSEVGGNAQYPSAPSPAPGVGAGAPPVVAPAAGPPAHPAAPAVPARPAPRQPAPVTGAASFQPVMPVQPGLAQAQPDTRAGQPHPQPPQLPHSA